jgi:tetratricopeptide (TPR) repeat protein
MICAAQLSAQAQTAADLADRQRALQLYDQNKFTEVIPLLEKLTKVYPDDAGIWERLGWAAFVVSASIKDKTERLAMRDRARAALTHAQQLGDDSNLLHAGLEALAAPDLAAAGFSNDPEAEAAMKEGEEAHSRGDLDKAIVAYQRALQHDPKIYLAALWTGDMYFKKGYQATDAKVRDEDLNKAGEWFARAIAINENAETAYRYWGDSLMLQGRPKDALLKFIDAIIADPGNRTPYMGLTQWGEQTKVAMAHPEIEVPVKVSLAGERKANVDFDPRLRQTDDASAAWENYGQVRAQWISEGFAKAYPNEKTYRHTLREETEALHKTAEVAAAWLKAGKVKSLSPSLAALVSLNDAGLLEPFILFTRADQGISQDYIEFRRAHRDKLRQYWSEVVVAKQ